jgi:hypothetical protein
MPIVKLSFSKNGKAERAVTLAEVLKYYGEELA